MSFVLVSVFVLVCSVLPHFQKHSEKGSGDFRRAPEGPLPPQRDLVITLSSVPGTVHIFTHSLRLSVESLLPASLQAGSW